MRRMLLTLVVIGALAGLAGGSARNAGATLPPGNAVQQWDKIAEDTVVGSGAFQAEGFIYMAYVSQAMYGALSPGPSFGGGYDDAAVVQAAYQTLSYYFPAQAGGARLAASGGDGRNPEQPVEVPRDVLRIGGSESCDRGSHW